MNNLDTAIFPEDTKTISQAIDLAIKGLTRNVGNLQTFVNKGNKITIEIRPEDGFVSIQLSTKEV